MQENEVSKVYAGALFELGLKNKTLSRIEEDFELLRAVLHGNSELIQFLDAPVLSKEVKKNFIEKILQDKLCIEVVSFLKVLIENDRQSYIEDVHQSLLKLIDEENERQRVRVVSSIKLDGSSLDSIKSILKEKLAREILIEEVLDESIMGGLVIEIGDTVIDGSVATSLKKMKEKILKSNAVSGVAYED